jgi:Holliday junction resolvase RusA-like endonuclease
MSEIEIEIPGIPIAKKRPRFARRGKFVTTYNSQETEEGRMLWDIHRQLPPGWSPINAPIKITTNFFMNRPKSHYKSGKNSNTIKNNAPLLHTSKPDLDNLQKMVYDCFNQVVWVDDSCVCESKGKKEYSDTPRTEIIVEVIQDGEKSE